MAQTTYQRPVGVALLEVYGFIVGVANVIAGIIFIADRNSVALQANASTQVGGLVTLGIVTIVFGVLQAMFAYFLGHGSNVIRMIYAFLASVNLIIGIWGIFALDGTNRLSAITGTLFSALVLYLLFNHRADEFFGHPYRHELEQ